jgi:hypothetical protein
MAARLWIELYLEDPSEMGASIPKCRQPDPSILKGEAWFVLHHIRDDKFWVFLRVVNGLSNDSPRESIAAVQEMCHRQQASPRYAICFFREVGCHSFGTLCWLTLRLQTRVPLVSLNPAVQRIRHRA